MPVSNITHMIRLGLHNGSEHNCIVFLIVLHDVTVNVVILTSSKFDDFFVRDNWRVLILTNFLIRVRVIYL